jgi:hypothetical protein
LIAYSHIKHWTVLQYEIDSKSPEQWKWWYATTLEKLGGVRRSLQRDYAWSDGHLRRSRV